MLAHDRQERQGIAHGKEKQITNISISLPIYKRIWSYDVRDIIAPYYVLFMCGYFFLSARHMQYAPSSTRGTESN